MPRDAIPTSVDIMTEMAVTSGLASVLAAFLEARAFSARHMPSNLDSALIPLFPIDLLSVGPSPLSSQTVRPRRRTAAATRTPAGGGPPLGHQTAPLTHCRRRHRASHVRHAAAAGASRGAAADPCARISVTAEEFDIDDDG